MTIAIVWYRERFDELWAVADTRISRINNGVTETLTDGGPKLFTVPVTCRHGNYPNIKRSHRLSFGFAFSGNVLAAVSTHAFVTSCTDNLYSTQKRRLPPPLADVAELYRKIGEYYVRDICSRSTFDSDHRHSFFQCLIFGYCPVAQNYQLHQIEPRYVDAHFSFENHKMELAAHRYFPIGSGTRSFVALNDDLQNQHIGSPDNAGVMITMKEYLKTTPRADIGGSYQVGVADRKGFRLRPILELIHGEDFSASYTHLGFELTELGLVGGYKIGDIAVGPGLNELDASHK